MADLVKLAAISAALRRPLPEKHTFDLGDYVRETESCGTVVCAIGLGMVLGIIKTPDNQDDYFPATMAELNMIEQDYDDLFMPSHYESDDPTPQEVADKIDFYIERHRHA